MFNLHYKCPGHCPAGKLNTWVSGLMKLLYTALILLVFGCSSILNQGKSNNFQIDEINIPTAQCNMCVANIENALSGIDGILKYKVELETYRVKVKYNTDKLSLQSIEQLISKAGYQANNSPADVDAYNKLAMCCRLPKDRR